MRFPFNLKGWRSRYEGALQRRIDPEQFRPFILVGEWLVLDDHMADVETDEQVISALLSKESDEHFLDIFPIDEYPGVSLAVLVESRRQCGCWFSGY